MLKLCRIMLSYNEYSLGYSLYIEVGHKLNKKNIFSFVRNLNQISFSLGNFLNLFQFFFSFNQL